MSNTDSLIDYFEQPVPARAGYDVTRTEANVYFYMLSLMTSLLVLPVSALAQFGSEISLLFGVLMLIASIPTFFIIRHEVLVNHKFGLKPLFGIVFAMGGMSIAFSISAVLQSEHLALTIGDMMILFAMYAAFSTLAFLIMTAGFGETVFMIMLTIATLPLIAVAYVLPMSEAFRLTSTLVWIAMFFLYVSICIYIRTGEMFFATMSFYYLIVVGIIAMIAIMALAGDGDCDCGSCDCDCTGDGIKRNHRAKIKKPPIDMVDPRL